VQKSKGGMIMSHNGGNSAPGRPRTEARKRKNKEIQERKKIAKAEKWKADRKRWKEDAEYQAKQKERKERLAQYYTN